MKPVPVVFYSPNQRHLYDRLIEYCRELDGTEIIKVESPEPDVPYPAVTNVAFRTVCKAMKGRPFIWLESDSIPFKKGWLAALQKEWKVAQSYGKDIVWTTDSNPPQDLCTGIGVYGPDAIDLVPEGLADDGFDGYILRNHSARIHRTPIIQHSYGVYHPSGVVMHRNPKPRNDAVIFHKDQFQDLIGKEQHFGSGGDLGDVIYLLPIIKRAGGGCLWLHDKKGVPHIVRRFPFIEPLIAAQSYIKTVSTSNGRGIDHDFAMFRNLYSKARTLTETMSVYGVQRFQLPRETGEKPWLEAKASTATKGKVIIARSPRYNNQWFPWDKVVEHYRDRLLFVGLDDEYQRFTFMHGYIHRLKVKDMLDMAEAIKGADLFIGNQSAPHAVAMGLGGPIIQETCLWQPDCVFKRSNVQYVGDGACVLPDVAGSGELEIEKTMKPLVKVNRNVTPHGGWQYPKLPHCKNFILQQRLVAKLEQCSDEVAGDRLYSYNVDRVPQFFFDEHNNPLTLFNQTHTLAFQ